MKKVTKDSLWRAYRAAVRIMSDEGVVDAAVDCGEVEIDGVIHNVVVKVEENED